jgi:hypothetical protein
LQDAEGQGKLGEDQGKTGGGAMNDHEKLELEANLARMRFFVKQIDEHKRGTPERTKAAKELDHVVQRHVEAIRRIYARAMS